MFKTRLLKWQLICLLIIGFSTNSPAFAVENQDSIGANQSGTIVSEGNISLDPATNPETISEPVTPTKISTIDENFSDEDANSECEPVKLPDGEKSYSRDVIVNEIFPTPTNGADNEYIELYNGGVSNVDLKCWKIGVVKGKSSDFEIGLKDINTIIEPSKYLVLYKKDTNISLIDTGDTVQLVDPHDAVLSSIEYNKTKRGLSWSRFEDGWKWATPSPNAQNIEPIVEENTVVEQTINTIKSLEDGVEVLTRGTVSVLPNVLSTQYFYIEDQSAGIQIYSYYKYFPGLRDGDLITVHGELSTTSGERRIKISSLDDIKILSSGTMLSPLDITIDEVGDPYSGRYVKVSGVVKSTSGKEFVLDGNREIKVSIKDGTNIKKPRMEKGNKVVVAGILAKYNETFRILPIRENDVKIVTSGELPLSGPDTLVYLDFNLFFYLIFIVWNIFLKAKKKHLKSQNALPILVNPAIFLLCLETWAAAKQHSPRGLPRVLVW